MLATGGGHLKKIFRIYQKNFPDIPHFCLNMKTFSRIYQKIFRIYIFFRKWKKFSGNNIDSSFQKCPLGKKCNLNDIFHARKGHFAPGKRALGKTWGAWPPCPPPVPTPLFMHIIYTSFATVLYIKPSSRFVLSEALIYHIKYLVIIMQSCLYLYERHADAVKKR
jgi:hypothetical protein